MKRKIEILGIVCGLVWGIVAATAAAPQDGTSANNSVRIARAESKRTPEQITKMWVSGPARYLMNEQEYEDVKKLKTVQELARFITEFWARRDPSPGTFENEYRREYWNRVMEANRRFRDSTVPGWKTDRGKIFVLLGEPNYVETDEGPGNTTSRERRSAGPGASDPGSRGIQRWIYNRQLSKAAAPEFTIAFVRDVSLDWRLSTNPDLLQPNFPGLGSGDSPAFAGMTRVATGPVVPDGGDSSRPASLTLPTDPVRGDPVVFANYDLGLEISVPSTAEMLIATVSAREFLSGFAATARLEFFRAQDGSTFTNIGALAPVQELYGDRKDGTSELRVYASVTDAADPSKVRYATNEKSPSRIDVAKGPPPGGVLDAWTGIALAPGRYVATIAIEDSLTGRLGRLTQEIVVPDLSGDALALSTLVPASSISESPGRLGVTERASGVFRKSEDFGIYYEVYGLPKGDGSKFEVAYRFYRVTEAGPVQVGKPIVFSDRTEGVQGWSFPLAKWPAGRFRIEVAVTVPDRPPVSSTLSFEVTD